MKKPSDGAGANLFFGFLHPTPALLLSVINLLVCGQITNRNNILLTPQKRREVGNSFKHRGGVMLSNETPITQ